MKKSGFTLAEVLIVLSIIGISAALILPAINNLKPDQNKIMYLKVHDSLGQSIQTLASNSKLFPVCRQADNISCVKHPLLNTEAPVDERYKDYDGRTKLCNLLALSMSVNQDNINCSENSYNFSGASFDNDFTNNISFTTQNGMQWRIVPQALSAANGSAEYQTDIYVDINGNTVPNCIYGDECPNPDRFKFLVDASGRVYAGDPMGQLYLAHRRAITKNNDEVQNEHYIASLEDIKTGIRNFGYESCNGNGSGDGGGSGDGQQETFIECMDNYLAEHGTESGEAGVVACGKTVNKYRRIDGGNDFYNDSFGRAIRVWTYKLDHPTDTEFTITNVFYNGNVDFDDQYFAKCVIKPGEDTCELEYPGSYINWGAKPNAVGSSPNFSSELSNYFEPRYSDKYLFLNNNYGSKNTYYWEHYLYKQEGINYNVW